MAKALEMSVAVMEEEWKREESLRNYFEEELLKRIPEIVVNAKSVKRLPGTSSITFKYLEESPFIDLKQQGNCSQFGFCLFFRQFTTLSCFISHEYSGGMCSWNHSFSLGKYNTKEEIDYTIEAVVETVTRLRSISPCGMLFRITNKEIRQ